MLLLLCDSIGSGNFFRLRRSVFSSIDENVFLAVYEGVTGGLSELRLLTGTNGLGDAFVEGVWRTGVADRLMTFLPNVAALRQFDCDRRYEQCGLVLDVHRMRLVEAHRRARR